MVLAQDERVVGIIPTARIKTGIFSTKTYTLVVTDRRLILAEMTNAALKGYIEESRAAEKGKGGGFFGQWGAQIGAILTFANRYLEMSPDAGEHPKADQARGLLFATFGPLVR